MTTVLIVMACLFPSSLLAVFWMSTRNAKADLTTLSQMVQESHRQDQSQTTNLIEILCSNFFGTVRREDPPDLQQLFQMEQVPTHPEDDRLQEEDFWAMGPAWRTNEQAQQTINDALSHSPPSDQDSAPAVTDQP